MTSSHDIALTEALSNTLWAYNQGSHKYLNEFIRQWKSASDMLILGIYPNAKEITESYGAFNAVRNKLKYDLSDPNVTLVSVGDGKTPRTATLFAFRTNWQYVSIDPMLDKTKIPVWESRIQRLKCIASKVEDVDLMYDKLIILAVHSHADLQETLQHVRGKVRSLVAIPCCVPYSCGLVPSKQYQDAGIWSPKNTVKVWRTI